MACSSGCSTPGTHATYGECMRSKGIQVDLFSLSQNGQPMEKKKWHTLNRFEQCVRSGLTPEAPTKTEVTKAEKVLDIVGGK